MAISPNQIRDVIKYLESGKQLPDEYRFKLFEEKREVELVWNGKTNEVCNIALPFQTIEQVDEPRSDKIKDVDQLGFFDTRGRQNRDWTNKLIWGDNKLILSSLKNGPLREEIDANGGIKLIYIDPPFDVGADFSMDIEIGDEQFHKQPTVLEELAYRDTWGKGADSFIAMIYERLVLMRDLLAQDGSIYVHCDWRVNSYVRQVLDELFGQNNLVNQITWKRTFAHGDSGQGAKHYGRISDTIFFYKKSDEATLNDIFIPYEKEYVEKVFTGVDPGGRRWQSVSLTAPGGAAKGNPFFEFMGIKRYWQYSRENLDKLLAENKIYQSKPETVPRRKMYLDESKGIPLQDIWTDISAVQGQASENVSYPTQKPEALLERIIRASSNENDVVCDFFCGSGTTLAVAEKLNRKWIGSDLGKFAIHTARKRLIGVQRQMKNEGKDYRAFEILNLGRYAREHYIGVNPNLSDDQKQTQIAKKEKDFVDLIIKAYKAESIDGFRTFHAKKNGRLVAIGPINLPVTRLFVEEVLLECIEKQISRIDILAFEFEMGLFPRIQEEAKNRGIDLSLKQIPREVFDKRAIEKNQVVFNDVSYIEVKPKIKGKTVTIELVGFSVFYSQDNVSQVSEDLKSGGNKLVIENGQILKVSKDKMGIVDTEIITKKWTDWIDYWSVDFDFEDKKEIIRKKKENPDQPKFDGSADPRQQGLTDYEEMWTGEYIFENEWQTFRIKKNRTLEMSSAPNEYASKGRRKVAVKVVDIFGNDTMKVIEINI